MALDCAHAAGGRDLTDLLPDYRSEAEAMRALAAAGFVSLAAMMDAHGRRVPSTFARAGMIALRSDGVGAFAWLASFA